jgi:hypothetical protein
LLVKEKKDVKIRYRQIVIKVGSELVWLWITIEPKKGKSWHQTYMERNMLVAEGLLQG